MMMTSTSTTRANNSQTEEKSFDLLLVVIISQKSIGHRDRIDIVSSPGSPVTHGDGVSLTVRNVKGDNAVC